MDAKTDLFPVHGGRVLGGKSGLVFVGPLWVTPTDIPAAEAAALLAFYTATGGEGWTNKTGWGTSATADDWYGVTVTAGHVTGIALANNNLIGDAGATLPTTLTSLDLGQNTGLTDIDVSGLISLAAVDLAGCEFGQTVVSGIMTDLVTAGKSSGTLDIGGSNSSPEPTGVTALMTLEDRSWTLTYSTIIMENTGTFYGIFSSGAASFRSSVLNLSGQAGKYIRVRDTAGKYAMAYGHAADEAESLGSELVTNGDMETGDPPTGYNAANGSTLTRSATAHGGSYALQGARGTANNVSVNKTVSGWSVGDRVKFSWCGVLGTAPRLAVALRTANSPVSYLVDTYETFFSPATYTERSTSGTILTGTTTLTLYFVVDGSAGQTAIFDDISLKKYLTIGTDAIKIRNAATGSTRAWTTIESGFRFDLVAKVEVFNG